jgi:AcrR family transcriptional regulator
VSRRKRLDKAAVLAAAARLLNSQGSEGLTLARLAETLSIQTPSLYNHIDGLPGLYRELVLMSTREQGERIAAAIVGFSGPEAVRRVAQAYRGYIKENTGLYLASQRSAAYQNPPDPALEQAQAQVLRVAVAVIASFSLSETDTLHAVRGLRSIIHGFAGLEVAGGFGLPLDCDESFRRLVENFIQGLQNPH